MTTRAAPLVVAAAFAFGAGVVVAVGPDAPAAQRFADAWNRDDLEAMYDELTPDARDRFSLQRFQASYTNAARTATIADVSAGEVSDDGDDATVPVRMKTNIFGELAGELRLSISDDQIAWEPYMVYPGLASDERLSRRTRAPERARILAADRTPLAEGPAAARSVGGSAIAVVGEVGAPSRAQKEELALNGFPPGTLTGISGLELAFNDRLSGLPGGQLL
ncbi:MAG: NTF2-like N-terminal transpeptidase domain-containing protein, partial [Solirubrobacterales bacterium]